MPDEYVQTGTYTEAISRIEYDYTGPNTVHCKFCAENGDVVLEAERSRKFIARLKLEGWNSRSNGVAGFILEVYKPEDGLVVDLPFMIRVPDEDVPAMYIDERPL